MIYETVTSQVSCDREGCSVSMVLNATTTAAILAAEKQGWKIMLPYCFCPRHISGVK